MAPALGTYQYQFKDTGILWNGDTALPFIDVTKVTGLDMPDIDASIVELDSRHGGYGFSKYSDSRTLVISGTLYANPSTVDVTTDAIKANFAPDDTEYPFYFKGAGVSQRYIMCKSLGVKYDIDRLRSIGSCPIQASLFAGDPRAYVDNAPIGMAANTNYYPANSGNVETFPTFVITGAFSGLTMANNSTGQVVTLNTSVGAGYTVVVDFLLKCVTLNGARWTTVLSNRNWWNIRAGGGDAVAWAVSNGAPAVTLYSKQGWW